jgi:hypothetical protein
VDRLNPDLLLCSEQPAFLRIVADKDDVTFRIKKTPASFVFEKDFPNISKLYRFEISVGYEINRF